MKPITLLITIIAAAAAHHGGAAPYENIYTSGHADLGVAYEEEEGGMHFHNHFGPGTVINGTPLPSGLDEEDYEYDIADVTTYVSAETKVTAPNIPAINDGTGADPGSDLWVLPQTQATGIPFLGFATEDLEAGDWDGNITFTLNGVVGPGEFSVWQNGSFASFDFYFSTSNPSGTIANNTLSLPTGAHAHYNWGFTAPGIYEVTMTVSGTHNEFGFVSDTKTITFGVETIPAVPEPGAYGVAMGLLLLGVMIARRRKQIAAKA